MLENHKCKDLVTIITPTYNAEKYIVDTINSVMNQTYQYWEMIIVDDCSTDNTTNLIKEAKKLDSRVKLIQLDENKGAAYARNTGIKRAKGRYIAFLDSDDLWLGNKLENQVSFMQEKDIAFSFSSYYIVNNSNQILKKVCVPQEITYKELLKNTIIGCLTVMLDIEKLGKVQMPNIRTRQDTALWLSILKKGYTAYGIQEPLARYRKVAGSISSNKIKMVKKNWEMYRKIEKLNFLQSSWCLVNYAWNAFKKSV